MFPKGAAIALGAFDGIHIGHKKLIKKAVDYACCNNCKSCIFTFDVLPSGAKRINDEDARDEILTYMGVDCLYIQSFDRNFRQMSAEDFMDKFLLGAKYISVGFNFRFGFGRAGNIEILERFCAENGIELSVEPPVLCGGETVSSTRIRNCIEKSEFDEAYNMLGRYYGIGGVVIHGNERGRTIGFPTANFEVDEKFLTPVDGVYITLASVDGALYKSFTNYGGKPTFGDEKKLMETHIFGFDGDLYGKRITVYFLKHIRNITTFGSADDLKKQLESDKLKSLDFFSKKGLQTDEYIV